ncbi:MAG: hypothetical protein H0V44_08885 [Planctomycetes bacterium]|nr:hypothetical protein [Planctomycetota bacterium]
MHSLIYFDVEDSFSHPGSPVHRLPGQFADILHAEGLQGSFHIIGEKARFMERHRQQDVIDAIRRHDVSLHYDRGSLPPTTATEVSNLGWFDGVERVMFRERTGFDTIERVFGRCTALTQHGGTFAAQIVYAVGKMGKPYFYSPFQLGRRNVVWYANNLMFRGLHGDLYFDTLYRDTAAFDHEFTQVDGRIAELARTVDYSPMFGCHPVITMMTEFPCANFFGGAAPPRAQWRVPTPVPGVWVPTILANFRRYVHALAKQPDVSWTTVAGMTEIYGQRPIIVGDHAILAGARAVIDQGGPAYTDVLSAGELLYLLARRRLQQRDRCDVPQVMGPTESHPPVRSFADAEAIATAIVDAVDASSYLPADIDLANAIVHLACASVGRDAMSATRTITDLPGMDTAMERIRSYRDWPVHGPAYRQESILMHAELQAWTLKPAMPASDYPPDVTLGRQLNPMVPWR